MSRTGSQPAIVALRPIERAVAAALLAGRPPAGMSFAAGYPSPFSLEVMDLLAGERAAQASLDFHCWFVVRTEDDKIVGEIGYGFDERSATATLGYTIVEPCWGRGYATGGVRALVEQLRRDARVRRVEAKAPLDHVASRRVMQKAGMQLCGQRLEEIDGELVELAVYELA